MRAAFILHSYSQSQVADPFRDERVNLFRGNTLEPNDLPEAALVFGGDGAVHRLLPALAGSECPLLVIPTGSSNDFARSIGIREPADALRAWRRYLDRGDNLRAIDLGTVQPLSGWSPEELEALASSTFADEEGRFARPSTPLGPHIMRQHLHHAEENAARQSRIYFTGIAGLGLVAEGHELALRMPRWLRRRGAATLAALGALWRHRPVSVRIESFDRAGEHSVLEGPMLLAAVGNRSALGGMRLLPQAQMDDGELDLCWIEEAPTSRVLRHFHQVYSGTHLLLPEVRYLRASQLFVESAEALAIFADGELLCHTPAEIGVAAGALRVLVP